MKNTIKRTTRIIKSEAATREEAERIAIAGANQLYRAAHQVASVREDGDEYVIELSAPGSVEHNEGVSHPLTRGTRVRAQSAVLGMITDEIGAAFQHDGRLCYTLRGHSWIYATDVLERV